MFEPKEKTIKDICEEVSRARKIFPIPRNMHVALSEEVGELAEALLDKKPDIDVYDEAKQVACVAIRIMEEGDLSFPNYTPPCKKK